LLREITTGADAALGVMVETGALVAGVRAGLHPQSRAMAMIVTSALEYPFCIISILLGTLPAFQLLGGHDCSALYTGLGVG
jgi:hypothetical protein